MVPPKFRNETVPLLTGTWQNQRRYAAFASIPFPLTREPRRWLLRNSFLHAPHKPIRLYRMPRLFTIRRFSVPPFYRVLTFARRILNCFILVPLYAGQEKSVKGFFEFFVSFDWLFQRFRTSICRFSSMSNAFSCITESLLATHCASTMICASGCAAFANTAFEITQILLTTPTNSITS